MKTNKEAEVWLRLQDLKYWRVYLGSTDRIVAKSEEKETEDNPITIDKSLHAFEDIMATLPAGEYMLGGRKVHNAYTSEVFYPFSILDTGREANDYQKRVQGVTNTYSTEIGALQRKIEDMERKNWERDIEQKYKNKYAKPEKENGIEKFTAVIGQLHSMWTGAKPAPAHVGSPEATPEEIDKQAQAFQSAVETLQEKIGGEALLTTIQKLAAKPTDQLQNLLTLL